MRSKEMQSRNERFMQFAARAVTRLSDRLEINIEERHKNGTMHIIAREDPCITYVYLLLELRFSTISNDEMILVG